VGSRVEYLAKDQQNSTLLTYRHGEGRVGAHKYSAYGQVSGTGGSSKPVSKAYVGERLDPETGLQYWRKFTLGPACARVAKRIVVAG
jgi:hypothetical protein